MRLIGDQTRCSHRGLPPVEAAIPRCGMGDVEASRRPLVTGRRPGTTLHPHGLASPRNVLLGNSNAISSTGRHAPAHAVRTEPVSWGGVPRGSSQGASEAVRLRGTPNLAILVCASSSEVYVQPASPHWEEAG